MKPDFGNYSKGSFPRDYRIDFWRGIALVMIFVNHIPGVFYSKLTLRNFGLSDAAEAFVFLAGFAAALAYLPKFVAGGAAVQSYRAVRRAGQIYLAHIVTVIAVLALFAGASQYFGEPELASKNPLALSMFFDDPVRGILGIATLGQQFGFLDILPPYVVFMLTLPLLMLLARIDLVLALGASAALYLATQLLGLALPSYPTDYGWYLNPLAWQFLFTAGFCAGALLRTGTPIPYHRLAHAIALAYLAAAAVWTVGGFWLPKDALPLPGFIWQIDKTNLSLPRLLHIFALAYALAYWPFSAIREHVGAGNPLVLIGRHPLPLFCVGILLSCAALIARQRYGGGFIIDTLLVAAGLAIMTMLAGAIDWYRRAVQGTQSPVSGVEAQPERPEPALARAA